MERHKFKSHSKYEKQQKILTRKKMKKVENGRSAPCFTRPCVIQAIHRAHKTPVSLAVCHGVRYGFEIDMFKESFGGSGDWFGTEITPELCDGEKIICCDFSKEQPEWKGKVDLMYSNSFDHSRRPRKTIKTWANHLTPGSGRLYVEWTQWHEKLGKRGNRADCFAASREEYREMFKPLGVLEELEVDDITRKGNPYVHVIFVIGSK